MLGDKGTTSYRLSSTPSSTRRVIACPKRHPTHLEISQPDARSLGRRSPIFHIFDQSQT